MLLTMIRDIIAADAHCDIVAEVSDARKLSRAVRTTAANLVILGADSPAAAAEELQSLLTDHPRTRVMAIAADGQRAFIHELRPCITEIAELSPQTLLTAIRQDPGAGAASGSSPVGH
jgi:DNA-binding NarL/FixJ family response regulator